MLKVRVNDVRIRTEITNMLYAEQPKNHDANVLEPNGNGHLFLSQPALISARNPYALLPMPWNPMANTSRICICVVISHIGLRHRRNGGNTYGHHYQNKIFFEITSHINLLLLIYFLTNHTLM